jgi:hypothetical protein
MWFYLLINAAIFAFAFAAAFVLGSLWQWKYTKTNTQDFVESIEEAMVKLKDIENRYPEAFGPAGGQQLRDVLNDFLLDMRQLAK